MKKVGGRIFDFENRCFVNGLLWIDNGRIVRIERTQNEFTEYVFPGLIDAHVHIESSMLVPSEFSRLVVPRGTIGVVTDPHEIANVLGEKGVEFMLRNAAQVPLKFFFGAPSCVPATEYESSGGVLDAQVVKTLLQRDDIWFLSEMMNFPGVIYGAPEVDAKLEAARSLGKVIDGHAPGLSGEMLKKYVGAGIVTDHECFSLEEAMEKIECGMKIQIREGSAAKNFETLWTLVKTHPKMVMLCTDDSHPDELIREGHMDKIIRRGLAKGLSIFDLMQACVINPVEHYQLPVGLLREGDPADFIVINNLEDFDIQFTYINGVKVFDKKKGVLFDKVVVEPENLFVANPVRPEQLTVTLPMPDSKVRVIEALDGELITKSFLWKPSSSEVHSDVEMDILKLIVLNRYQPDALPQIGFIRGFGLQKGALASSVAHDSHNVIAIGVSDQEIVAALNLVIENKGGIAAVNGISKKVLPLPVGGIMSSMDGEEVAEMYEDIDAVAKQLGCMLRAPFMTLSFMSLLVIPELKLGDKGLFDVSAFKFVSLIE
jgi:adenine deaminase